MTCVFCYHKFKRYMRERMFRRRILTAVGVVVMTASILVSAAWVGHADAAQTATVGGNALKVSPVRMDVKMDPGVTQKVSLYIQNLGTIPATLHAAVNDFVAAGDESGRPNIILDENEYAPSHSLKRLTTPPADFTVAPGENKEVKVTIIVPKNAAGGGYFGAIRFEPADAEDQENLNLSASVGSLMLLRVNGDVKEDLTVESFDVRKKNIPGVFFLNKKDLTADVRFKNNGNIHVEPFGKVTLKRFSKVIAQYEINDADIRGNVLPDSVRKFSVALNKVGDFGKYSVEGNFGYGSTGQLLTAKTTFYVIPLFMIIVALCTVLLLVFFIFILPRMIRSYNRRIIRRANRRR
jgi:hypothetical protein